MKLINAAITSFVVKLIRFYQKTLSPDHGFFSFLYPHGFCRYYPSCSEYARQAVQKHGCLMGLLKGIWRVLRCNPFGRGGIDQP
jgi:putative membrane protein insertion efficiency factor